MHTEEKKQRFSPKQSVSLLTKETYVDAFESNFGSATSVPQAGFILTQEDTLEGGYHGRYDSGTIDRPYRTQSLAKAREKLTTFQEKIYATPEKMAKALNQHTEAEGRYRAHTESLVRVRLTRENPGKIAIFKDDQASRWYALYLQALTAAQFKEQANSRSDEGTNEEVVEAKSEEKSITPPIYYYLPDSLKCFSDYTAAEQATDRDAAEAINSNENQAFAKIQDKEFWFLLGLSKESLVARLDSKLEVEGVDMPVLSYLMLTGYVGLARGLAKLAGINASEERYWAPFKPPVAVEEKESDSPHPLHTQADPQFIGQAALHFPEQYKRLDSPFLEVKDSNGETALHTAAKLGFPKRVAALLAADGINVNAKDNDGYTPLQEAASRGHVAVVNALLGKAGIDLNAIDKYGYTPLHLAAIKRHVDMVNALLGKAGIDLNAIDKYGYTPLHLAAQFRHVDMVKLLVLAGADAAGIKINGQSILHWAAANDYVDVVKALLSHQNIQVNLRDNWVYTPLHLAAERGHVDVVRALLVAEDIGVNLTNKWGYTPLHEAAQKGHLAVVKALLSHQNIQVNLRRNSRGYTPLHWAAANGHVDVVNALLSHPNIQVNLRRNSGHTPLHLAARGGRVEVVKKLVLAGADATGININGQPILHWAAANGYVEVVEKLVLAGADAAGIEINGQSILHWAAENGHVDVVKALLSHPNIQVNLRENSSGYTPLHLAARGGRVAVVKALLSHQNIQVNLRRNSRGYTPLHWAARGGRVAVVKALLSHQNIQVNLRRNSRGYTPLHWAAANGHVDVVNALIQKRANINATDNLGNTPLHEAAKRDHVEVVKKLVLAGADAAGIEINGQSILHWAAQNNHVDVVNALIQKRANINATDNLGNTPLHLAVKRDHVKVVEKLVLAGADVTGIKIRGQPILHWAAANGHGDVVQALIQGGANINAKDTLGKTPLHWAAEKGHVDVVKTLLKADQQGKLFQGAILIERSAVVVGALLSSCLFAESISPKGWIDTLSQALQAQVGSALCAAVLLAGCIAACRQLFYLRSRAAYAQATCRQQAVIVGGKFLMTGAAATLFAAVTFPQTGLIALCNNPLTAGIVFGAVCLIGVASYMSDRTYTTVISAN
jgi:ankyrin repeat protein